MLELLLSFIAGMIVMKIGLEWYRTLMVKWRYKKFINQIAQEAIEAVQKAEK
jgi:hypothetical protein